jgi:hypothetical protein
MFAARLAALRADADARAADGRGEQQHAADRRVLAASYRALHGSYREREAVFAAVMADRADWDAATRAQRHLAVAADAEIRRRHPGQRFTPLPLDGQVHPGQALQQPGCPREWPCSRNVVVIAASFGDGSSKGRDAYIRVAQNVADSPHLDRRIRWDKHICAYLRETEPPPDGARS